ncbi:hypothetical protein OC844_003285 [Tilletia horrida]|nr:hypothetical protein OC844_003285 [Tilletia horrida]
MSSLRVQVATFNCNLQGAAAVSPDLAPWLVPTLSEKSKVYNASDPTQGRDAPDIYAVGFQELLPLPMGFASNEEATDAIDTTDREIRRAVRYHAAMTRPDGLYPPGHTGGPESYDLLAAVHMVGIVLFVYTRTRANISARVKEIRTAKVGTGLLGIMGNKGAVGLRLVLAGANGGRDEVYTFLSAHLAAHDHNVPRRNRDWANIVRRMVFTPSSVQPLPILQQTPQSASKGGPVPSVSQLEERYKTQKAAQPKDAVAIDNKSYGIYDSTHLFVCGDLNYRIALKKQPLPGSHADKASQGKMNKEELRWRLASSDWPALASYDQLTLERVNNRVFHGLTESHLPSIKWGPTYKFKVIKPAKDKSPFETGNFSKDEKMSAEPGIASASTPAPAPAAAAAPAEKKKEEEEVSETTPLFTKISAPTPVAADGQELSKKRVPGWTDRILWASAHDGARLSAAEADTHGVDVELYRSVVQYTHSDHKPVTAILKVDASKQPSASGSSAPVFLKDSTPKPIVTPYQRDPLWQLKLLLGALLDRLLGLIWTSLIKAGAGSLITGVLEAVVVLVLSLWYLRGGQGDASWWLSSVLRGGRS